MYFHGLKIEVLIRRLEALEKKVEALEKENAFLRERLAKYENPKNSSNCSMPPSKDENRPKAKAKVCVSLRTKVLEDKKAGKEKP